MQPSFKRRLTATLYGLWLTGMSVVFYAGGSVEAGAAVEFALLAGVVPAGVQVLLYGFNKRVSLWPCLFSFLFTASIVISYVGHVDSWISIVLLLNLVFIFAIAISLASCPEQMLMESICAAYAISTALFLLYINLFGEFLWGRLTAHLHPNHWGFLAVSCGAAAFAIRNLGGRFFCLGIAALTIYNASARGSLLALSTALLVAVFLWLRERQSGPRLFLLAGVCWLVIAMIVLEMIPGVSSFVTEQLLKLHDPGRGLNSGFTGRFDGWIRTVEIWARAPLFGIGYRLHEQFVAIGSAHNAYLAVLADTGVFGLIIYLAFIGTSVRAGFHDVQRPAQKRLLLMLIIGYAAAGIFERRALNTGNPFSLIFVFACVYALNARVRHRLADAAEPRGAFAGSGPQWAYHHDQG